MQYRSRSASATIVRPKIGRSLLGAKLSGGTPMDRSQSYIVNLSTQSEQDTMTDYRNPDEKLLPVVQPKPVEGELLEGGKRPEHVDDVKPGHTVTFDLNTRNGLVHIEAIVQKVTKL